MVFEKQNAKTSNIKLILEKTNGKVKPQSFTRKKLTGTIDDYPSLKSLPQFSFILSGCHRQSKNLNPLSVIGGSSPHRQQAKFRSLDLTHTMKMEQ